MTYWLLVAIVIRRLVVVEFAGVKFSSLNSLFQPKILVQNQLCRVRQLAAAVRVVYCYFLRVFARFNYVLLR